MTHYFESIINKIAVRYIIIWLCLVAIMGLYIFLIYLRSLPDNKTLTLVMCDVGQGDAIYLIFPNGKDMLIDGGPDGSILTCLGKFKPFWDRSIDVLLYTHPDLDHFGGFLSVIRRYSVGKIIHTHVKNLTPEYVQLQELIRTKNIPEIFVGAGDSLEIAGVLLYWLWPTQQIDSAVESLPSVKDFHLFGKEWNTNDLSQVIHLRYGVFDALFTGDAGFSVASYYLDQVHTPDGLEILKVPHHGSLDALNENYLQSLRPDVALLSVGKKNRYRHPRKEILALLDQFAILTYSTAERGTFLLKTDGKLYTFP